MELRRYIAVLRRRLALILLAVLVGLGAGYASTNRNPGYSATATLYVGSRQLLPAGGSIGGDVLSGLERFAATYASMIDTAAIARDAVQRAHVNRSPAAVVAETDAAPKKGTQLLLIRVIDPDPATAQALANGLADAFVDKLSSFEPSAPPQPGEVPALPAYVFERAALPVAPQATALVRHVILGALFGFALAAGVAFLLEYLDITVKSVRDAERKLELPVLGVIPLDTTAQRPPEVHVARAS